MGVVRLWEILEPTKEVLPLEHLANKRLCVDLSYWIVQLSKVNGGNVKDKPHLRGLFHRIRALVALNCHLVFVADGAIPKVKSATYNHRLAAAGNTSRMHNCNKLQQTLKPIRRNKGSEFGQMIKEAKEMGDAFGIPCLDSLEEAEAQCATLNRGGVFDGCLTADSDALLFGARVVYKEISLGKSGYGGYVIAYNLSTIQRELGFGRYCLIGLAFLLGSDYFPGIKGVGPEKAQQIIKNSGEERIKELVASQGPLALASHLLADCKISKKAYNVCGIQAFEKENINPTRLFERNTCGDMKLMGDDHFINEAFLAYCDPKTLSSKASVVKKALIKGAIKLEKIRTLCLEAFEWPFNRTDEYVLPKVAESNLRALADAKEAAEANTIGTVPLQYTVSCIVKLRNFQGMEQYEVRWLGNPEFQSSVVPADLVRRAYPEKVSEFLALQCNSKKKKVHSMAKNDSREESVNNDDKSNCRNPGTKNPVLRLQKCSLNLLPKSSQDFEGIQGHYLFGHQDQERQPQNKQISSASGNFHHISYQLSSDFVDSACASWNASQCESARPRNLELETANYSGHQAEKSKETPSRPVTAEVIDLTTPISAIRLVEGENEKPAQLLGAANAGACNTNVTSIPSDSPSSDLSSGDDDYDDDEFDVRNHDDGDDIEHRIRALKLRTFLANLKKKDL